MTQKRTEAQRLFDKVVIGELYALGTRTHQQIADFVNADRDFNEHISRSQVTQIILDLKDEWRQSPLNKINEAMNEAISLINAMIKSLWYEWEKSCQKTSETRVKEGKNKKDGEYSELEEIEKTNTGNIIYIREIKELIKMRLALHGFSFVYLPEPDDPESEPTETAKLDIPDNGRAVSS